MAKSRAVKDLLVVAVALASKVENVELTAGIEKLEAIEDASGGTQEYKDLKALVATLQDAQEVDGDDDEQNGAGDEENTEQSTQEVEPKKYNYAGVKMIGAKWYCIKDNYKKGFNTANECAEHFND